jgi:Family of unknown function (DUF6521)
MARPPSRRSLTEVNLVQNPALGAYALWQFGLGYQSHGGELAKLPAAFLVLPIVLHRPSLEFVSSTQKGSGLALFAAKLAEREENLLAVHTRSLALRHLTLRSLGFAINTGIATLNYEDATLRANTPAPKSKKPQLPERLRALSNGAEKLGYWFAKMSLPQTASTLRVEF